METPKESPASSKNNEFLGVENNFISNPKQMRTSRKSIMSFSKYGGFENSQENMEEIDLKIEFDIRKNFKIYFPHNNSDFVIQNLTNKIIDQNKSSSFIPNQSRRRKNLLNNPVSFNFASNTRKVHPKEKSFLTSFLRKNLKVPTIYNLIKGFKS